ncbi:MAG: hypothetical protein ACXWEY_04935, partial [Bacteroidia bacterium]
VQGFKLYPLKIALKHSLPATGAASSFCAVSSIALARLLLCKLFHLIFKLKHFSRKSHML